MSWKSFSVFARSLRQHWKHCSTTGRLWCRSLTPCEKSIIMKSGNCSSKTNRCSRKSKNWMIEQTSKPYSTARPMWASLSWQISAANTSSKSWLAPTRLRTRTGRLSFLRRNWVRCSTKMSNFPRWLSIWWNRMTPSRNRWSRWRTVTNSSGSSMHNWAGSRVRCTLKRNRN